MKFVCVRPWLPAAAVLALAGCGIGGPNFVAKHEPWRNDEESACLASGVVRTSPFLKTRSALGGPSVCGTERPLEMSGAMGGRVTLKPAALLRCPMVPQVESWTASAVAPAAERHFGVPIRELTVAASYGCRPINHVSGGRLSEHGYANAIDVSAFILADGRKISVKSGWYGSASERAFLRDVHRGACRDFSTVLGPEADANHRDHFHFDLARHGRTGMNRVCR